MEVLTMDFLNCSLISVTELLTLLLQTAGV